MLFSVDITEKLNRAVNIEANTADEALEKAQQLYRNSDIVLDSSDFSHVEFSVKTSDGNTITI